MIYVDELMEYGPAFYRGEDAAQAQRVGEQNGHRWCHLFATESDCEELHDFAFQLGLRLSWFQGNHYDLTPGRRAKAVKLGAIEVTRRQAVAIRRAQRGELTP